MIDPEIAERLVKVEERAKSNTHQIEELKPVVNEIHTISKTMVELMGECRRTNENVDEIKQDVSKLNDKVENIEKEPAKEWSSMKRTIFNTLVGALAGALATGLLALLAQFAH